MQEENMQYVGLLQSGVREDERLDLHKSFHTLSPKDVARVAEVPEDSSTEHTASVQPGIVWRWLPRGLPAAT